ncbi:DUF72 domain-containing protein [Ruicaihuangia caeni]|uniref:DUF72 domain-containing protein n=1 Tax=Ruicaihuangia caeni TaxID=3042517 RepID=A0AAW6T747_9MICO|nr:DUF72 domain-containing protein [Klugiella sp. YN-L-19]MDI2099054.1 DUF72 domain-containing protein [Klugiella sp. YN-L-19]
MTSPGRQSARRSEARVGISGWVYKPWRGVFYPKGLKQAEELAYASRHVTSIEINGSFYSLQRPASWAKWRDTVPGDFVFAVKGPRFITHIRRLQELDGPLANFFASGVLGLGTKLGPFLWQLPPTLPFEAGLLDEFLSRLPHTLSDAAGLATGHDAWMDGRAWFEVGADAGATPVRHAVEVRHPSFETAIEEWTELLQRHKVASVTADSAGKFPVIDAVTADFAYARLHGKDELYVSGYDADAIEHWATWCETHLAAGRDVFVYFDNDTKVRAPVDAMSLIARLGQR